MPTYTRTPCRLLFIRQIQERNLLEQAKPSGLHLYKNIDPQQAISETANSLHNSSGRLEINTVVTSKDSISETPGADVE